MLAQEIIRLQARRRTRSTATQIDAFVRGLVDGSWSEAQAAAMAMAICLRGHRRRRDRGADAAP